MKPIFSAEDAVLELLVQDEATMRQLFIPEPLSRSGTDPLINFLIAENRNRAEVTFKKFFHLLSAVFPISSCSDFQLSDGDRHENGERPIFFTHGGQRYVFKFRSATADVAISNVFQTLEQPYKKNLVHFTADRFSVHNFIESCPVITDTRKYSYNLGFRSFVFTILRSTDLAYDNVLIVDDDVLPIDHEFLLRSEEVSGFQFSIPSLDFLHCGLVFNLNADPKGNLITRSMNTVKGFEVDIPIFTQGFRDAQRKFTDRKGEVISHLTSIVGTQIRRFHRNTMDYYQEIQREILLSSITRETNKRIHFEIPLYSKVVTWKTIDELVQRPAPCIEDIKSLVDLNIINFFTMRQHLVSAETLYEVLKIISLSKILGSLPANFPINFYSGVLGHIFFLDSLELKTPILEKRKSDLWNYYIDRIFTDIAASRIHRDVGFDLIILSRFDFFDRHKELEKAILSLPSDYFEFDDLLGGISGLERGFEYLGLNPSVISEHFSSRSGGYSQVVGRAHGPKDSHLDRGVINWCKSSGRGTEIFDDKGKFSQCLCCGTSAYLLREDTNSRLSDEIIQDIYNEMISNKRLRINQNPESFMKGIIGITYAVGVLAGKHKKFNLWEIS